MRTFITTIVVLIIASGTGLAQREAVSTINNFAVVSDEYSFDIWARSSGATALRVGTSQFFFDFNDAALSNPSISNINPKFTGLPGINDYDPMTAGIIVNKIAVTISFTGNETGVGQLLATNLSDGERICTVTLSVLDTLGTAGLQWDTLNSAITSSTPNTVINFFVGSDNSILTGVAENVPLVFSVSQNYPNPFNPKTTIRFTVDKPERASLIVYDILGQEVTRLFEGEAQPGRYYAIELEGKNLASGTYFYRLIAGTRTEIRKMMLLK